MINDTAIFRKPCIRSRHLITSIEFAMIGFFVLLLADTRLLMQSI